MELEVGDQIVLKYQFWIDFLGRHFETVYRSPMDFIPKVLVITEVDYVPYTTECLYTASFRDKELMFWDSEIETLLQ